MTMTKRIGLLLCVAVWGALPAHAQENVAANLTSATCSTTDVSGCATLNLAGSAGVAVQIEGTFTGTISFEASVDGGTYIALTMVSSDATTTGTTTTTTGVWVAGVGGYATIRARMSAYTSGTAQVMLRRAAFGASAGGGGSLPAGAATAANQTSGGQKTIVVDGGGTEVDFSTVNVANGSTVVTDDGTIDDGQTNIAATVGMAYVFDGSDWVRRNAYGSATTMTWTGTSLANGSGRQSTVVNMTAAMCSSVRIRVQTKGQTSGTAYLDWYVYTSLGDTTYTDLATGSDAAFTAANRFNSRYLGSTLLNADTTAVTAEMQLGDVFGVIPDKWGLIGINNSGAALSATAGDHVIGYQCVK